MCLDHTVVRFFIARTSNVHCDTPPEVVKARSQLPLWGLAVKRKKKSARIITPTMAPPMQTRVLLNPIRLHGLLSSLIRSRFTPFRASIRNQCHRDRVNRPIGKIGRIPFERSSTRVSNVHHGAIRVIENRVVAVVAIELFATKYFIPTSALEVGVTVG